MDNISIIIKYNTYYTFNISKLTTIEELKRNIITKIKNFKSNNFFLLFNNKLLHEYKVINDYNIENNNIIQIIPKIKGGRVGIGRLIKKIMNEFLNSIFSVLNPITGPFKDIVLAIVSMAELLVEIIKLIPLIIETSILIFTPDKLIDDIIHGLMKGINTLFITLLNSLNLDTMRGKPKASTGSGAFGVTDKSKKVCVTPKLINLIILVLCPPLQLFLYKKMKGIFLVIICALMTYYLYYFPGLIFAALHVLC